MSYEFWAVRHPDGGWVEGTCCVRRETAMAEAVYSENGGFLSCCAEFLPQSWKALYRRGYRACKVLLKETRDGTE